MEDDFVPGTLLGTVSKQLAAAQCDGCGDRATTEAEVDTEGPD